MSAFCLSSVISSSAGSLSAQLLSALIASVANESGDAENKEESDYRNPHTEGNPFHHAGKRGFIQLCLLCICQRVYSILCNQINSLRFAIIGKLQCAEGLPFFDCALYTFGNIRLYGNGRGIRSLRQGVLHILAWCNRHLA